MKLKSCLKAYNKDLDKARSPDETVAYVKGLLKRFGRNILLETKRIDTGRLGIPVFFSIYGEEAQKICPSKKQMGKGATPSQAEASAIMELVERYSFFFFWERNENFEYLRWTEAREKFKDIPLIDDKEILKSVDDSLNIKDLHKVLDLVRWKFCKAYLVSDNKDVMVPGDWFKQLNEYNGASAGNTFEESILQGACELIERHVSAIIDREERIVPTIDLQSINDPVAQDLIFCFKRNNIELWLKDFSLNIGVPTVGALAYDPSTFPEKSEIVFTAGTATSPNKAAIRALTEVAQLAGDFCTNSRYEPSGLRKFKSIDEAAWVMEGDVTNISTLPDISNQDLYVELISLSLKLKELGFNLYSINTTHPKINIPCNYNFIPGFLFRERSKYPSVGLFVGRRLAELEGVDEGRQGLDVLEKIYGQTYFVPFFRGILEMKTGNLESAMKFFEISLPLQPDEEERSMVLFYMANILVQNSDFKKAIDLLDEAISSVKDNQIYYNLRGICKFKLGMYEQASKDFLSALDLDRGSAIDLANLGMCYKMMGKNQAAIQCLKDALEIDPSIDFARNNLEHLIGK